MPLKNINPQSGSVSIDSIETYTRQAAGETLNPPIKDRQVRRYLELLTLFSDNFAGFKDPLTGGLNGEPITDWHLIELQDVRDLHKRYRSKIRVQTELAARYGQAKTAA